jgi:amidase
MVAEATACWGALVIGEIQAAFLPLMEQAASPDTLTFLRSAIEAIPPPDYAGYIGGFAGRLGIARAWTQFQERYPLVLGPVATMPPFRVGRDLEGRDAVQEILQALRLVVAMNLLGLPVAVVPVGVEGGLPQSVQIIGGRYREDLCLDAAEAIEERLGVITPIDPR